MAPAALLMYNGRTLIEGLLRDFGRMAKHVTPVAIMTSAARVITTHQCVDARRRMVWARRGGLFEQPLVPVVTTRWCCPRMTTGAKEARREKVEDS